MMNFAWDYSETAGGGDLERGPFRQLGSCFDLAAVRSALIEAGAMAPQTGPLAIENVWYVPAKSLHVVYGAVDTAGARHIVTVRYLPAGESAAHVAAVRQAFAATPGVHHVPAMEAVAWVFPADPRLTDLDDLVGGAHAASIVARATGSSLAARDLRFRLFSYLPGERCTAGLGGGEAPIAVVAKKQKSAARTHAAMQSLWQASERSFRMAEPLAADDGRGVRWERFVPGQRLESMPSRGAIEEAVARAMTALAGLHHIALAGLPARDAGVVVGRLAGKVVRRIEAAVPALRGDAERLAGRLAAAIGTVPLRRPVTIHGDFHTANILFDGSEPVFIDLDELAVGDPAYDLALFATRLMLGAALRADERDRLGRVAASLPRLYADAGGDEVSDPVYAWYVAAMLVQRQVKTCIRHAAPGSGRLSHTLMTWADRVLARGAVEPGDLA